MIPQGGGGVSLVSNKLSNLTMRGEKRKGIKDEEENPL